MAKGWLNFVKSETGASRSEAVSSGHTARDDMQSVGWMSERAENKGESSSYDSDFHERTDSAANKFFNAIFGTNKD